MEGASLLLRVPDLVLEQITSHLHNISDLLNFRMVCRKCHYISLSKNILDKTVLDLRKVGVCGSIASSNLNSIQYAIVRL